MRPLLLVASAALAAHAGTFQNSAVTYYSSKDCSSNGATIELDSCSQLPNLPFSLSLSCSSTSIYTLSVCPSANDCSSSLCVSVQGDGGDCQSLSVASFLPALASVTVDCSLTPLSIALIVVAVLALAGLVTYCFVGCIKDALRVCYERGAALEAAEALLASSDAHAKASQLRLATAQARVDAHALKTSIARLEADLLSARLEQARRAPGSLQAPRGGAAAEAEEGATYYEDFDRRPQSQWTHPRGQ